MSSYGTLSTADPERECAVEMEEETKTWRHTLGEKLETQSFHMLVLGLVLLDATCVVIQIIYTFFHECQVPIVLMSGGGHEKEKESLLLIAFEMAELISIFICLLFLVECLLSLIAFGPRYYLPGWPHWKLHVFDAAVVFTTFVLEVGLRGKEREVAGLLIVFRLWRVVKVIEAVVMSVSFTHREELDELKVKYAELEEKNRQLLLQLNGGVADNASS